jgi:hypothetical protein
LERRVQSQRLRRWVLALGSMVAAQACSSDSEFRRGPDGPGGVSQDKDAAMADSESLGDATSVFDRYTVDTGRSDSDFPDTGRPDTGAADTGSDTAIADAPSVSDARIDRATPDSATPDSATPDSGTPDARSDATIGPNDCALVSCGSAGDRSCCTDVYTFAVDAMGRSRPSLVTGFTVGATELNARFRFEEAGQNGAIGMAFNTPRVPTRIRLTATSTGPVGRRFLTLEAPGAGCAYPFQTNWEADLQTQLFCWGGSFTPDAVSFRIEGSAAGDATLTITKIEIY